MTKTAPAAIITGAAAIWASDHAANIAERALTKLAEAGYVIVQAPSVSFKGPHDTDQSTATAAPQADVAPGYRIGEL